MGEASQEESLDEDRSEGGPSGTASLLRALEPAADLRGKNVIVLGLARQGSAVARYLCSAGARVTISDLADEAALQAEIKELADLPISFSLGGHPPELLDDCDLLVLSGGVPLQIPFVQQAISLGVPLSNDALLTLQLAHANDLGPVIVVSGSSGKTTTTTLVGEMLAPGRTAVHIGGNIGTPLVDRMHKIRANEPIVLEFSSFQLELFDATLTQSSLEGIGPQVAGLTNITPNHLDRHPSMRAYVEAKLNMLRTLPNEAQLVVNFDDPVTAALIPDAETQHAAILSEWDLDEVLTSAREELRKRRVTTVPFSLRAPLSEGARLDDGMLTLDGKRICTRSEVHLRGEHNIANILAAAALSRRAGADLESIRRVAKTFQGVPHRLELVTQADGITWINDSIATSPERAVAALRSFDEDTPAIILLAGGKDKNLPWDSFSTEVLRRVRFLIGFGDSGAMIVGQVQKQAEFSHRNLPGCATVKRLEEAVALAMKIATPGSIVLLAPGGTSFDAYKDFEERGEHFRRLVLERVQGAQLPGDSPTDRQDNPPSVDALLSGDASPRSP